MMRDILILLLTILPYVGAAVIAYLKIHCLYKSREVQGGIKTIATALGVFLIWAPIFRIIADILLARITLGDLLINIVVLLIGVITYRRAVHNLSETG